MKMGVATKLGGLFIILVVLSLGVVIFTITQWTSEVNSCMSAVNGFVVGQTDQAAMVNAVESAKNTTGTMTTALWIFIALAVVIIIPLVIIVMKQIVTLSHKIVGASDSLSMGDATKDIDIHSNDEMGQIADGFRNIAVYVREMATSADAIAAGNLGVKVQPKSAQDTLGNAFAKMVDNLSNVVIKVKDNASKVDIAANQLYNLSEAAGNATQQVSNTSQQIALGASDQATTVQDIARSIDQLSNVIEQVGTGSQTQSMAIREASTIISSVSASSDHVSVSAQNVAASSKHATEAAHNGVDMAKQTVAGMDTLIHTVETVSDKITKLGERSSEIGRIVAVIDDIAAQTNLLALNAAIEAARAGEQGRGFAVVSDEVRKLAERTAASTKEIADLIGGVQRGVEESIKAMEQGSEGVQTGYKLAIDTGGALTDILQATEDVGQQINEIASSIQEVSAGADSMVTAIDTVSSVVEQNSSAAQQMAKDSAQVARSVESLAGVAEENSAATQEVSASTQEVSTQMQELAASASSMAHLARGLQDCVAAFHIDSAVDAEAIDLNVNGGIAIQSLRQTSEHIPDRRIQAHYP